MEATPGHKPHKKPRYEQPFDPSDQCELAVFAFIVSSVSFLAVSCTLRSIYLQKGETAWGALVYRNPFLVLSGALFLFELLLAANTMITEVTTPRPFTLSGAPHLAMGNRASCCTPAALTS